MREFIQVREQINPIPLPVGTSQYAVDTNCNSFSLDVNCQLRAGQENGMYGILVDNVYYSSHLSGVRGNGTRSYWYRLEFSYKSAFLSPEYIYKSPIILETQVLDLLTTSINFSRNSLLTVSISITRGYFS